MLIKGSRTECLIDTGSKVNIIPAHLVEQDEVLPTCRIFQAANGTTIGVMGEVELPVQVADQCIKTCFVISDQVDEVLIGVQWLHENGCRISFPDNTLTLRGSVEDVPLLRKTSRNRCNRVILQEDVQLPPSSEMNVLGKVVYSNLSTTKQGVWATCTHECQPGVHVACSLLPERSQNVPIRILNVRDKEQCLKKGMNLSAIQEVTPVDVRSEEEVKVTDRKIKTGKLVDDLLQRVDEGVSEEEKIELRRLLESYEDVISCDEMDLGLTDVVEHCIDTGEARPCRQPLRRTPAAYSKIIEDQIQLMLKQGIIQPSISDWSSNVVLVKKKDGSYRFCVDFRNLNKVSVHDSQPIPRIDSCLEALAGSCWFSTLDMRSGFFQVKIREQDAKKTNFIVRSGSYNFRVMPMGLCNSTATF